MNKRHLLLLAALLSLLGLLLFISRPAAESDNPPSAPATPAAVSSAAPASTAPIASLAKLDGQAPARRALDIQRWTTAEGARVLFVEARELPMFDLRLTFAAGSSQDGATPGLAMLTNSMLNEGIADQDTTAIAAGFESLGAGFGNGAYRDMAVASLRSLSAAELRTPALDLFARVVGAPTFPDAALARMKNQLLSGFELQKQNPGKLASIALFQQLYGRHPYAQPSDGTAQSVPAISREQLAAFHARAYAAGNAVIALVGDLSRSEAEAIAAQLSASLPKGAALPAPAAPAAPAAGRQHIEFPSQQTHLMLAQLGIDRRDPDYAALYVGNQILGGGGFGTRLMEEVREKRGLTYGIYSAFSPMQVAGPFMINVQTRAELSEATLELVRSLVRDFIASGPTAKELSQVQRELAGSFPLSTASNADIVGQLGAIGFYDLPSTQLEDFMNQVQQLSVEQVRAAMARHLDPDAFVVVSSGPTVAQQPLPPPVERPAAQTAGVPEH
ncbi:insulinase family protein [Pseudomonas sp. MAP12]|uniref:Insulinase family protein n=1 Tax=Geopseudomonas aromaticivorans TaxID=2849492 RepID=A0ABS6MZB3_9GAMM|nr:pitrilysin family protein [Pseudomonas aromaticivorans]MBV2134129.1 insulinase family protein [Pseudomonas aromaticivorans]